MTLDIDLSMQEMIEMIRDKFKDHLHEQKLRRWCKSGIIPNQREKGEWQRFNQVDMHNVFCVYCLWSKRVPYKVIKLFMTGDMEAIKKVKQKLNSSNLTDKYLKGICDGVQI